MKIQIPKELIDEGYISVQKHPEADYFIYNYSPKTMYEGKWNEFTMLARGLILNSKNVIIARPFKKFFNMQEYTDQIPEELINNAPCEIYEKVDGSLGVLYHLPSGEPRIATRGSFMSEQSVEANKIFNEKYRAFDFDQDYTFLFEIIYPSNRIVVNYGEMRDLILLGGIHKETGEEAPYLMLQEYSLLMGVPLVEKYNFVDVNEMLKFMKEQPQKNSEGFVIKFSTGLRMKVKYDEYVKLHSIVTNISTTSIWEYLKDGVSLENLFSQLPDEFYKWIDKTAFGLNNQYNTYEQMCKEIISQELNDEWDMATVAKYFIGKYPNESGILFAMLKGKNYRDIIWKMIRPKFEKGCIIQ